MELYSMNLQRIVDICEDVAKLDKSTARLPALEVFKLVATTNILDLIQNELNDYDHKANKNRCGCCGAITPLDKSEYNNMIRRIRDHIPGAYERHYGKKFENEFEIQKK